MPFSNVINFAKRSPWDIQQLAELSDQLEQFKTLARLKAEEANQLRRAKELLEQRLGASEASIGYDERGLVTRMLDAVLFDALAFTSHKKCEQTSEVALSILRILEACRRKNFVSWEEAEELLCATGLEQYMESRYVGGVSSCSD